MIYHENIFNKNLFILTGCTKVKRKNDQKGQFDDQLSTTAQKTEFLPFCYPEFRRKYRGYSLRL